MFLFFSTIVCLINTEVERHYTFQGSVLDVFLHIRIENDGKTLINKYNISFLPDEIGHLGIFYAFNNAKMTRNSSKSLKTVKNEKGVNIYLKSPLKPKESTNLFIYYTFNSYCKFIRSYIFLNQPIGLLLSIPYTLLSDYPTKKCTTAISGIEKSQIINVTQSKTNQITESGLFYSSISSEAYERYELEFYTRDPLVRIKELNTEVTLSLWGRKRIMNSIVLLNDGPKLLGEFNRVDFNEKTPCHIYSFPLVLQDETINIWANDESGRLSQHLEKQGNTLSIPLRGPVLSGWKSTFNFGWIGFQSLFCGDNYSILDQPLLKTIPSVIDNFSVQYIFPELTNVVNIKTSVYSSISVYRKQVNLDWKGRTIVNISFGSLTTFDIPNIEITYQIPHVAKALKPLFISFLLLCLFFTIISYRQIFTSKFKTD